ncbi:putative secreted protein [Rhodopirellula maiorica SM1]|uniref:Putative secreted protein n=1 Tax=Rhodopirellula maiorica SM1 TaxID=1265738 RepID=M5RST9_9BACT|nr:hypothetical protein [Rhodopirellula maiorica]EMI17034.1 putative secreted protein [Rhodopirellula maiorica SM1]
MISNRYLSTRFKPTFLFFVISIPTATAASAQGHELWQHIDTAKSVMTHGVEAAFDKVNDERRLTIEQTEDARYAWASIESPAVGWNLGSTKLVEAEVENLSAREVDVLLWVVPDKGWGAVGKNATIEPGETLSLKCNLRATYKDNTPKLNPNRIRSIEVMLSKCDVGATIRVKGLKASGSAPDWVMREGRIEVPNVENGQASAGRRVRYKLSDDKDSGIYCALHLPESWMQGKLYPVIVEFPGNIYFTENCYSTGLPDQGAIGFGMGKHVESIWVTMPFVEYAKDKVVTDGWGNADDTADYTIRVVNEIIGKFGGDRERLVITGFSRGAIACGYIGRRNDSIASLWRGFHACQHYDGDGWKGATLVSAKARAGRIGQRPIFHTDNDSEDLKVMLAEVGADVTYASSGLGAHATAMFLDERPSTLKLQEWYAALVHE